MKKPKFIPNFAISKVKKKILHPEEKFFPPASKKEKKHHFSFEKPLSVLPNLIPPALPSSARKLQTGSQESPSLKKSDIIAHTLSQNQSYPLELLEKSKTLQSKGIKNLHVKEQLIAGYRLKALGHKLQQSILARMQHQVQQVVEEKQEEENYYPPTRGEERQFQITRIIPYLCD